MDTEVRSAGLDRQTVRARTPDGQGASHSQAERFPTPPDEAARLRIVVVEDDQDVADSLQLLLELLGYEVRVAYTGPDGVRLAKDWVPGVVLSDIGLPGLDGFGVARCLRRNPATAEARLVAITGYGSEETRRRARESGFDYCLTKPADPDELERLLAASV
jgi:CheY-like chemotaxis protein